MIELTEVEVAELKELAHEQLIYDTLTMFNWIDRTRKMLRRVTSKPTYTYPQEPDTQAKEDTYDGTI